MYSYYHHLILEGMVTAIFGKIRMVFVAFIPNWDIIIQLLSSDFISLLIPSHAHRRENEHF